MRLIHWIFAICLFTASFDVALVLKIGGTIRIAQVLMVFVILGALGKVAQTGTILWPAGGTALAIWCFLQIGFMPTTSAISTGTVFNLTLFYTIIGVYAALQLYGRSGYLTLLMKTYLASYIFVGIFGIFQLVTPPLHLGSYFVTQWIVDRKFPRINGFSYEPSYFASYVLMGWIMLLDLRAAKATITSAKKWKWITVILGVSLFLSTSRTAWLVMALEGCLRGLPIAIRALRYRLTRFMAGNLTISLPRLRFLILGSVFSLVIVGGSIGVASIVNPTVFLSGTGIGNTASHSVDDRTGLASETLVVLSDHPFIGQGFAGVAQRIAELHGHEVNSMEDLKLWRGFPVILEVIAASGVVGAIPFLWFMGANSIGTFGLIRHRWPDERAKWLRALVRALFCEFIVLLESQNLIRVYLWFHLTMIVIVSFNLRNYQRDEA